MITKTEMANDSQIKLHFKSLTTNKRFENLSFVNDFKIKLRFENLTSKKRFKNLSLFFNAKISFFNVFGYKNAPIKKKNPQGCCCNYLPYLGFF